MTTPPSCPAGDGITRIEAEPISIQSAVARFEREAVPGSFPTGRYQCKYFTWGQGPPLLFIHGIGDRARSFLLPISRLADHFRCIAYDLPTGRGDRARMRRYRHDELVADAFALLDHLGISRSYIFGMSFGSTVALAMMHAKPERIPRGVLQGGFARRPLTVSQYRMARVGRFLPGSLRWLPVRKLLWHVHGTPFQERPRALWDYFLTNNQSTLLAALAHHALIMETVDLRPVLQEIRQPILMICGDCDPLVGRGCEQDLLNGLPNAGRVELPICGHFPNFTHPEVVAEVVRRFLTPPPCPT